MKKYTEMQKEVLVYVKGALLKGQKLSDKYRPIGTTGSGRYAQYTVDHSIKFEEAATSLGVKYVEGNDAAKGGKLGNYIQLKVDKRNPLIKQLESELKASLK